MSDPQVFGYGSLVNLATHDYHSPRPATLHGWRRVWRHSSLRPVAFLSVEADAGSSIQGVVAQVPQGDWAALDAREHAYVRRDVTHQIHCEGPRGPTAVYEVDGGTLAHATTTHPILLSYIDVVVQGYLRLYGPQGAAHFFATTKGWNSPILNDRGRPHYPRSQSLAPDETRIVDAALATLGCRIT
jgi:hypothetical protein